MKNEKVIDREEMMDGLKAEERSLRNINDDLRKDNLKLTKAGKAIEDKTASCIKELTLQKESLGKFKENQKKTKNANEEERKAINAERELLETADEANEATKASADESTAKHELAKKQAEGASTGLKKARLQFNKDKEVLRLDKIAHEDKIKEVEEIKGKVQKVLKDTEEAKADVETKIFEVEEGLVGIQKTKDGLAKKQEEFDDIKKEGEILNANVKESQKALDELTADVEKRDEKLDKKHAELTSKERSLDSRKAELDIREQEIETEDLRVQKIVRDNGIADKLKKAKKELDK